MKREQPSWRCAISHWAFLLRPYVIVFAIAFCLGNASFASEPTAAPTDDKTDSKTHARGVSLGEYMIRSYYPVDAQKSTVRFTLYAAVKGERFAEVQRVVEEHREKLRDLVITATRLALLIVFQEPNLATFRRRVLVRLRRALPELEIDDLYVSDFDLVIKSL